MKRKLVVVLSYAIFSLTAITGCTQASASTTITTSNDTVDYSKAPATYGIDFYLDETNRVDGFALLTSVSNGAQEIARDKNSYTYKINGSAKDTANIYYKYLVADKGATCQDTNAKTMEITALSEKVNWNIGITINVSDDDSEIIISYKYIPIEPMKLTDTMVDTYSNDEVGLTIPLTEKFKDNIIISDVVSGNDEGLGLQFKAVEFSTLLSTVTKQVLDVASNAPLPLGSIRVYNKEINKVLLETESDSRLVYLWSGDNKTYALCLVTQLPDAMLEHLDCVQTYVDLINAVTILQNAITFKN